LFNENNATRETRPLSSGKPITVIHPVLDSASMAKSECFGSRKPTLPVLLSLVKAYGFG